jgi:superfamily II DNA or RNA helicase
MRGELREWQKQALGVYRDACSSGRRHLLWEATPGAGKTTAALRVCRHQLKNGARRVIVVVPTTHLKLQWARSAHTQGLSLDTGFGDSQRKIAADFHGVVVTYQQVGNRPDIFTRLSKGAVVVLDEVHHAADGMSWGNALRMALKESSFILCLSGTAFRSDNNSIPFVAYDDAGVSQPDYVYSYENAIENGVCRPTVFFTYGGEVAWSDGELQSSARFSDPLDRVGRTKRLRAALDPESGWIEPMLKDAQEMLMATRKTHPEAAGLLVASSQKNARALARVLRNVSGVKPVVVLSEDTNASAQLKRFTAGTEPWLVACNMVSEGVDIPRLRVGIYATTIRTKMYFRQFLGRIVRRTVAPVGAQPAFCYLPADPWLTSLAEEIEEEQRHCIKAKDDDDFLNLELETDREREEKEDTWRALSSINSGVDSVIMGGGQLSLWGDQPVEQELGPDLLNDEVISPAPSEPVTRAELKGQIVKEIRTLVSNYHHRSGAPHSRIHAQLNRQQKVESQKECTESQLKERLDILEKLLDTNSVTS